MWSLYVQRLSLTPAGWNTSSCLSQCRWFPFIPQVPACWDLSPPQSPQRVTQHPVTQCSAICPRFLLWALFPPMLSIHPEKRCTPAPLLTCSQQPPFFDPVFAWPLGSDWGLCCQSSHHHIQQFAVELRHSLAFWYAWYEHMFWHRKDHFYLKY